MRDSEVSPFSMYQLMEPAQRADPYPWYRRLRDARPIRRDPHVGSLLVARHAEVAAVLENPAFSAARLGMSESDDPIEREIGRTLGEQMLFLDPPDHTRLRKLFAKAFTPRRLDAFRPRIEALTHQLLDACAGRRADFIGEFAVPLPVMAIALVLGVPTGERERLHAWSLAFGSIISGRPLTVEEVGQAQRGIAEFRQYFAELIAARRAVPEDDMLSDLVAAEEAGDRLDEGELISNLILLLAAGHATTTHLLGNGLLALAGEREQWRRFVAEPSLAPTLVSELLRFDAPVQVTGREAREDVELDGMTIPKGQYVHLLLGAANRDERQYAEPDRLDIGRTGTRMMSFGHGIHTCLGAVLARIEAQIVFGALAERFPDFEVHEQDAERTATISFRGLRCLPVTLR
ncbi:cytochrome P450 [Burkholderia gladioli]|uniref:cytochrome P450 n=1 Tax=Burkholderia gladioli TaxID=28095 RepID=UPI001640ACC5|nr:cytochrome P450 [Burkholderia gladioli]